MENYLQQGIMAAKAGDKVRAFDLLTRASDVPATSEQAWLWLSSVVTDDSERLFCLDKVLRINPESAVAQRGATMLRQKGIFPAVPAYPAPQTAMSRDNLSKPALAPKASQVNVVASTRTQTASMVTSTSSVGQQFGYETEQKKQELLGLFQYAAMELSSKKPQQVVERLLVGRGASPEVARAVAKDAQSALRKVQREKSKKRMVRGLLWTIGGLVVTCGTYVFADKLGGSFYLFWGAIIFGFIDFVVGLVGWLAHA